MKPKILPGQFSYAPLDFVPLSREYLELTRSWRNQPRVRQQFWSSHEISAEEHLAWFETYEADPNQRLFIVFNNGDPIGQVGVQGWDGKQLEFGRLIIGEAHDLNHGFGSMMTRAALLHAKQHLPVERFVLTVKLSNQRALNIYRKAGFQEFEVVGDMVRMEALASAREYQHTVVMGSYNRPHLVRLAIRSVFRAAQAAQVQMIVTDDGSDAQTIDAIREELARAPSNVGTLFVQGSAEGVRGSEAAARAVLSINRALPFVSGDLVHYFADDDLYLPGRFEAFEAAFANPEVQMVYGRLHLVEMLSPHEKRAKRREATDKIPFAHEYEYDLFPGGPVTDPAGVLDQKQVVHRAEGLRSVPFWPLEDIGYSSDGVFFRKLASVTGPIHPMDVPVAVHVHHRLNLLNTRESTGAKREPEYAAEYVTNV